MRVQKRHHNSSKQYLLAAFITLGIGIGVLVAGIYIIKKAESSVVKYQSTIIKKDKK